MTIVEALPINEEAKSPASDVCPTGHDPQGKSGLVPRVAFFRAPPRGRVLMRLHVRHWVSLAFTGSE
ncbi:hypothetical protein GEV33_000550 [Tenebrio molitor]|uniref:Uncharacterized protein n=1 Tax=Tenebrio molitor TaxID=7067 RepID=A0A8J6HUN8_TENMO|nr:hypothetical protein GEV33_000550 [Tenebrio molitor]